MMKSQSCYQIHKDVQIVRMPISECYYGEHPDFNWLWCLHLQVCCWSVHAQDSNSAIVCHRFVYDLFIFICAVMSARNAVVIGNYHMRVALACLFKINVEF